LFLGNAPTVDASTFERIGEVAVGYIDPNTVGYPSEGYNWNGIVIRTLDGVSGDYNVNCSSGSVLISDNVVIRNNNCSGTLRIPASVTEIGPGALSEASDLSVVTFPSFSRLTKIEDEAFLRTGLNEIEIPPSVTSIGTRAFSVVGTLEKVSFGSGSSLTSIGEGAFYQTGISSIVIPRGVSRIENDTFAYAGNLTQVSFEEGTILTSIGAHAFNSSNISTFIVPPGVTSIGDYAFQSSELETITIPSGVSYIGEWAFNSSIFLTKIFFAGNAPVVGSDAFIYISLSDPAPKAFVKSTSTGFPSLGSNWNGLIISRY
jgi:hypothetical protein